MNDQSNGFGGQLPKESKLWKALDSKTEETTQHQDMPPESDDEDSSISDNDSDSLSTAAKIMEIVSKRKSDRAKVSKKSKNSEKRFSRRNGVIYISDDFWPEYREYAYNAHIYVASTTEKSIIGSTAFTNADENSINRTSTPPKGASISSQRISPIGVLPPRLAIVNELLLEDISETCIKSNQHINHDQTAPYRSLIPWEGSFRKRHQSLEAEFADIAHANSTHPAVLRDSDFLPTTLAYAVTPHQDKTQAIDAIDNSRILLDGYRALIYLLDNELNQLVVSYRSANLGTVDKLPFSHLWYLFNPGQEIIVKHPRPQVYRVLQVTGGRQSLVSRKKAKGTTLESISDLVIDCFFLDYDGEHFGPMACTVGIKPYDDVRRITDLSAYPLDYDNTEYDDKPLRTYLADRGKKFAGFAKLSHQKYKGFTVRELGHFDTVDEIDSDVIIDFDLAYRLNTFLKPVFGDGVIATPTREDEEETNSPGLYYDDDELVRSKWAKWLQSTDLLQHRTAEALSSDHYILLPNRVYAYVLLSRRWCPLDIDNIKPVPKVLPGENDGFKRLVLPDGHKNIVRALINTHARKVDSDKSKHEFDVVKGKGRGLIILLHGAPGVGKTSTAECVAANAGKPLFPITCGDIGGETAQEVERNLENYFNLARKWNSVLLLDEADVFLAARERGNIRQNSLVSVFLRVLEYYPGILILTTNRVGSFDEAIKSRVHCALYYPKLNKSQSLRIWKMNIQALEEQNEQLEPNLRVQFDKAKIKAFAENHWEEGDKDTRWNGRQIKNAFQTAISLAQWDSFQATGDSATQAGPVLKAEHFNKVAIASKHFDRYLVKTRRGDEDIARGLSLRDDSLRLDDESGSRTDHTDSEGDSQSGRKSKRSTKKNEKKPRGKGSQRGSRPTRPGTRKMRPATSSSEGFFESQQSSSELWSEDASSGGSSASDERVSRKHRGSSKKRDKRR